SWAHRKWEWHDRATRFSCASVLPYRTVASSTGGTLLRCCDPRLWDHVFLCGAGRASRPLGHCRVHSRLAEESECETSRGAAPATAEARGAAMIPVPRQDLKIERAKFAAGPGPLVQSRVNRAQSWALIIGLVALAVTAYGAFA